MVLSLTSTASLFIQVPYEAITAWGTLGAAVIAAVAVIIALRSWQSTSKHQRLALSSELLMNMVDRFNDDAMRQTRADAAQFLLDNKNRIGSADELRSTVDIVNFFESVANFVYNGALDKRSVWFRFYIFMYTYWFFAQQHLQPLMRTNPMYWVNVSVLTEEFHALSEQIHKEKNLSYPGRPSESDLEAYLRREAQRRVQ